MNRLSSLVLILITVILLVACVGGEDAMDYTTTAMPEADPTATAVVPATRLGAYSQEFLVKDARQLAAIETMIEDEETAEDVGVENLISDNKVINVSNAKRLDVKLIEDRLSTVKQLK